jgi:DNA mismatch repair protein MutS2
VTEERHFFLRQTAHPLLWWSLKTEEIIRNEIDFGVPASTLLLTGPNTGGKTVLLKTLGLAGICARTGFPFPATDHPVVPFFDSFFADLGDSQSIEQHLSSFSGHVVKFKEILDHITDQSLILIDELNSATDPEEGAAFGRAVLETLMSRNSMIVTTTHDPHLKALAITDPRILNASMAFDEKARTPTYLMVSGIPGRSRALETAERLGIPQEVIQLAKRYLSPEHNEFEKMLAKLEADTQDIARARKEALALREEAERLKKEWTERTESSVQDMLERARQKLRRIHEQAQDEVRTAVRKLDEVKNRREIDKTRSGINDASKLASAQLESVLEKEAPELAKVLSRKTEEQTKTTDEISLFKMETGSIVRIPKWKSTGTIMEITGSKVKVTVGKIQMTLSTHDIELISPPSSKKPMVQTRIDTHSELTNGVTPPSEIDLRGTRFDEAMSYLEHYLDASFRSGIFTEVTVIHGLGTGSLREGAHKLLKELPYIKSFRDGGKGKGGTGATIVEFERQ